MSREILDRPAPAADVRLHYGPGEHHFGDLRLPSSSGPHPAIIAVHGGFWRSHRSLDYMGHVCEALRDAGIATWNIEYRRMGHEGGGYPGTLEDAAAASDHVSVIAAEHRLDLRRAVAIGHSAGGQIALWLAGAKRGIPLRGAVSLGGVADLQRAWDLKIGDHVVDAFMNGGPEDKPDAYRDASPIERLPFGVPHRLIHGDRDDIVPIELAKRHTARAAELGDDCRLIGLPGADHFELVDPSTKEWTIVQQTIIELLS